MLIQLMLIDQWLLKDFLIRRGYRLNQTWPKMLIIRVKDPFQTITRDIQLKKACSNSKVDKIALDLMMKKISN
jgi:hypothetical protein